MKTKYPQSLLSFHTCKEPPPTLASRRWVGSTSRSSTGPSCPLSQAQTVYGSCECTSMRSVSDPVKRDMHFRRSLGVQMKGAICAAKRKGLVVCLLIGGNPTRNYNQTIEWYVDFLNKLASCQIPYHDQPVIIWEVS